MNSFNAIGRIGKDAVTRHTQAGKAVTGWSLAVDKGWGDRKETIWLDCSMWGERGEKIAEHIRKGERLGVTGEIGTREHEGKTYLTLDVRDVTLLGGKSEAGSPGGSKGPQRQRPQRSEPADDFADENIPF